MFPQLQLWPLVIITVIESQLPPPRGHQQAHNRGKDSHARGRGDSTRNPVCCRVSCLIPVDSRTNGMKEKHGASSHTNLSKIDVGLYVCSLGKLASSRPQPPSQIWTIPRTEGPSGLQSLGHTEVDMSGIHRYHLRRIPRSPPAALTRLCRSGTVHLKIYMLSAVPSAKPNSRPRPCHPKSDCHVLRYKLPKT